MARVDPDRCCGPEIRADNEIPGFVRETVATHGRPPSATSGANRQRLVQSVQRAMNMLGYAATEPTGMSLSQISGHVRLHPSTAHRILATLAAGGYVSRDPVSRTYRLGPLLISLGEAARAQAGATPQIRAILGYLAQESGELANFAALDGMMAVYVAQSQPGPGPVTIFTRMGTRVPLHCTGVGKAMLAFLPDSYSRALIDGGLKRYTSSTIVGAIRLERELKRIRHDGYAIDNEEYEVGVRCVASPLRDRGGGVIGAISVSGPSTRLGSERIPSMAKLVREAARAAWPQADGKPSGE